MTSHNAGCRVIGDHVGACRVESSFIEGGQRHVMLLGAVHSGDLQFGPCRLQPQQYVCAASSHT